MTNVSVTSSPISATVTQQGVSATVSSSTSNITTSGGVGPQGPPGNASGTLNQLQDVQVTSAQAGDLLQYGSTKWQNNPTLDGGNY